MREQAMSESSDLKWVVFDGPVDALWIENMNTVLDDNMMLCLANGQRIKLRNEMRMLFEVQDLAVASPATVSRCGMVYLTTEELGWYPFVKCWIHKNFTDQEEAEYINSLFTGFIDPILEKIRNSYTEPIKTSNL
jgi:dynein heavy chain, axonemal